MTAADALQQLLDQGVEVRPEGDTVRIIPGIPKGMKATLVQFKPELVPMVQVLTALEYGPMKRDELMRATGLEIDQVYSSLAALYDRGMIKTDPESWYYLPPQFTRPTRVEDLCPSCRHDEAQGVRVLACSVCDRRLN